VLEGEGLAPETRELLEARPAQLNPFARRREAERHLRQAFGWGRAAAEAGAVWGGRLHYGGFR